VPDCENFEKINCQTRESQGNDVDDDKKQVLCQISQGELKIIGEHDRQALIVPEYDLIIDNKGQAGQDAQTHENYPEQGRIVIQPKVPGQFRYIHPH